MQETLSSVVFGNPVSVAQLWNKSNTDRGHTESGHTDSGHTDSGHTDRCDTDSGHTDRCDIDRCHTDRCHTDRGHTDKDHTVTIELLTHPLELAVCLLTALYLVAIVAAIARSLPVPRTINILIRTIVR